MPHFTDGETIAKGGDVTCPGQPESGNQPLPRPCKEKEDSPALQRTLPLSNQGPSRCIPATLTQSKTPGSATVRDQGGQ